MQGYLLKTGRNLSWSTSWLTRWINENLCSSQETLEVFWDTSYVSEHQSSTKILQNVAPSGDVQ